MKIFVKDFFGAMQAKVVIIGMQVNDRVLCCGAKNQPSTAYSSLHLFSFLSFYNLNHVSYKISKQFFRVECTYLVYGFAMAYYIVGLQSSLVQLILLVSVCFFFLLCIMTYFIKDFFATTKS